jgi:hypothetical protein
MKRALIVLLLLATPLLAQSRRRSSRPGNAIPVFVFDSGFRVLNATNPAPGVDPVTGQVWIYYVDQIAHKTMVRIANDGLNFGAATEATSWKNDSRNTLMPYGKRWRRYQYDPHTTLMTSSVSSDGANFIAESGTRYAPQPDDHSVIGVYDLFSNHNGDVVLLYIGDLTGRNNVRRAVSHDGGLTFAFDHGNVLGDDNAGGGPNSFVDEKSLRLPDGRLRLFTMRKTVIYSFISNDDGLTFAFEPGARLQFADYKEATLTSLNDPVVVHLPDGRYRMYVASLRSDNVWTIVSATTQ